MAPMRCAAWAGVGRGNHEVPKERSGEVQMTGGEETGQVTGTKDKDYNVIWFTEACLSNALRLETYIFFFYV